ncbi:hypothetical protein KCP74_18375 [Salmonella enterica subsp. enterica]|nr:hypothetical protein KCP74_18375 [Salmonella enterica subsp. enterica]
MPQSVIQLKHRSVPKKNCYNIKLTAQKVETVNTFQRSRNKSAQAKPNPAGRGHAGKEKHFTSQ